MPPMRVSQPRLQRFCPLGPAIAVLAVFATVAACSSSGGSTSPTSTPADGGGKHTGSGSVNVLYAGSLVDLMEKQIDPAFKAATGFTVSGFAGGSTDLAADISGKVRRGDVFISASPTADESIMGAKNGNWTSWYATFGTAPLVLGYNPHSKFAKQLKSKPWYRVVTQPGFRLGKTDPKTDPKGELAAEALDGAAKKQNLPALAAIAKSSDGVYPEETLVGRLQAGQLDAGFFYSSEAGAAGIPTVPLTGTGTDLTATYTITILKGAPNEAGAEAFVKYFLGPQGLAKLKQNGVHLVGPTITGSGVPSLLHGVLKK